MASRKELSGWFSIAVPIIFAILAAMIGFTVTGLRDRITDNEEDIQRCIRSRDYQTDQQSINDRLNILESRLYEIQR